jgi:Golgi phosphoprotein 3 (GPP34)
MTRPSWSGVPWARVPLLLADELFCVAHDDRTGRSRLHPRVLGLGLAAGLLGELVLFGRVDIADGGGIKVLDREPPADALAHSTLSMVMAQPQHRDVRTWLAFLAETSVESVAQRLVLAGLWQREERRRLGRARVSYLPTDTNAVFWRSMRLGRLLSSVEEIGQPDAMLAGLVAVTGLVDAVLWPQEDREPGLSRITDEVKRLSWPLYHLLAFTEAAVGDAVLAPR